MRWKSTFRGYMPNKKGQELDKGCSGHAFIIKQKRFLGRKSKEYVAKQNLDKSPDNLPMDSVKDEARNHKKIPKHKNIIKYKGYNRFTKTLLIEKATSISLENMIRDIKKIKDPSTKERVILKVAKDILEATKHLRDNNLCHNDTHDANWMLGQDGHLKLIDFGRVTEDNQSGLFNTKMYKKDYIKNHEDMEYVNPLLLIANMIKDVGLGEEGKTQYLQKHLLDTRNTELYLIDAEEGTTGKEYHNRQLSGKLNFLINGSGLWEGSASANNMSTLFQAISEEKDKAYEGLVSRLQEEGGYSLEQIEARKARLRENVLTEFDISLPPAFDSISSAASLHDKASRQFSSISNRPPPPAYEDPPAYTEPSADKRPPPPAYEDPPAYTEPSADKRPPPPPYGANRGLPQERPTSFEPKMSS